jgi:hypothetical protein
MPKKFASDAIRHVQAVPQFPETSLNFIPLYFGHTHLRLSTPSRLRLRSKVLMRVPLREFPLPRPATSCLPYPKCSSMSACEAVSRTFFSSLFCKEQGLELLLEFSLCHFNRHGFHGVAHDRSSPPGTARRARPTADPDTPFQIADMRRLLHKYWAGN